MIKGRNRSCRFFRMIFTYTNDGLFKVRLGLKNTPHELEIGESYCENTKEPTTSDSTHYPRNLYSNQTVIKNVIRK